MENKESLMLERAYMFLEEGKWAQANEYCDRILDENPRNAEAHLGRLMADCKISRKELLVNCKTSFENNINYQRTLLYADTALREELKDYLKTAKNKIAVYKQKNKKKTKSILSLTIGSVTALSIIILSAVLIYSNIILPKKEKELRELQRKNWLWLQDINDYLYVPYDTEDIVELGTDNEIYITDNGETLSINEFLSWFHNSNTNFLLKNYWESDVNYTLDGPTVKSVKLDLQYQVAASRFYSRYEDQNGKVPYLIGKGMWKIQQDLMRDGWTNIERYFSEGRTTIIYEKYQSQSFTFTVIYKKGEK